MQKVFDLAPAFPSGWLNHWVTQMCDWDSKIHRNKLYVYVLSSFGLLDQQEHVWCHIYSFRRAAHGLLGAQSSAMNKTFSIRAAYCYAFPSCLIHTRSPWRQSKRRKSPPLPYRGTVLLWSLQGVVIIVFFGGKGVVIIVSCLSCFFTPLATSCWGYSLIHNLK